MSSLYKLYNFVIESFIPTPSSDTINESDLDKLKQIGKGSFGTVYSAVWDDKRVAIKVFSNSLDDSKELRNYKEEVEKTIKLEHKNVVIFYGETQIKERNAFVMELADSSLDKIIHKEREWYSFNEALRWLMDVAEGVSYMHSNRIIHRDLKPANLLIFYQTDGSSIVKVADFGISREKHTTDSTITAEVGTPAYMAPEVVQGSKYDHRCDVYSFGIIVWEIFSKQKPFAGMSNIQILFAVGNNKQLNVESVNCSQDIRILIKKCWEIDFQKRLGMWEVLAKLESSASVKLFKICSLDQRLQENVTRSSLDKWLILSRLPADLKSRVRLAAVVGKGFNFEATFITEDDEAFWVWAEKDSIKKKNENEPIKITQLSNLKIKSLFSQSGFQSIYCLYVLTDDLKLYQSYNLLNKVFDLIDKTVVQVACGERHTLALTSDGEVFAWGDNFWGQLGTGSRNSLKPMKVTEEIGTRRTLAVACCYFSSFALINNGDVFAWGENEDGQLGLGDNTNQTVPKRIEVMSGIKIRRLAGAYRHVLAVSDDGSIFAWGYNEFGQLGTGDTDNRNIPVKIGPSDVNFIEVAACNFPNDLSVALSEDGRCWVWGRCRTGNKSSDYEKVLFPKPVESISINDAIAEYAITQTTWKTMVIKFEK